MGILMVIVLNHRHGQAMSQLLILPDYGRDLIPDTAVIGMMVRGGHCRIFDHTRGHNRATDCHAPRGEPHEYAAIIFGSIGFAVLLMLSDASPESTGGGIKTTTSLSRVHRAKKEKSSLRPGTRAAATDTPSRGRYPRGDGITV